MFFWVITWFGVDHVISRRLLLWTCLVISNSQIWNFYPTTNRIENQKSTATNHSYIIYEIKWSTNFTGYYFHCWWVSTRVTWTKKVKFNLGIDRDEIQLEKDKKSLASHWNWLSKTLILKILTIISSVPPLFVII